MDIVVCKFGGTSINVESNREIAIEKICNYQNSGKQVVVVVSAMGRKGDPYATDTLIELMSQIDKRIDPLKKDFIMCCGEIISAAIISHMLESRGIYSIPMTGFQAGVLTSNGFTNSEILKIDSTRVKDHLKKGKIVVITGFQGLTKNMELTTLGRGGSDITALAIGSSLKAKRIDIFTDVPGVAVADPRIIPEAPIFDNIPYAIMLEMAINGAKVVHPRAIEIAIKYNIPFYVRSIYNGAKGTFVSDKNILPNWDILGISKKKIEQKFSKITVVLNPNKINYKIKKELDKLLDFSSMKIVRKKITSKTYQFVLLESSADVCVRLIYNKFFVG